MAMDFPRPQPLVERPFRSCLARPARFGFQREVNDYFVAVVYVQSHGQLLSQMAPHEQKLPIFNLSSPYSDPGRCTDPSDAPDDLLLGRGFDLLRLEKHLSQSRIVYLHGLYNIGKAAFLKHAAAIWKLSNFVDTVVCSTLPWRLEVYPPMSSRFC